MKYGSFDADTSDEVTVANSEKPRMDVAEARVTAIRDQIQRGDYQVDAQAVAEAILRRLLAGMPLGASPNGTQNECSYPDNPPS
jgi:anti-sigma-28 factor FlgM